MSEDDFIDEAKVMV